MATPRARRRFNRAAEHPPFIFVNRLNENAIVVKIPASLPTQTRLEYTWLLYDAPLIAKALDLSLARLREIGDDETADALWTMVVGEEESASP
jgi:hypothetical protein